MYDLDGRIPRESSARGPVFSHICPTSGGAENRGEATRPGESAREVIVPPSCPVVTYVRAYGCCPRVEMHVRESPRGKKKRGKKRKSPVRWSGLISEISSTKKFRSLPPAPLFLSLPLFPSLRPRRGINAYMSPSSSLSASSSGFSSSSSSSSSSSPPPFSPSFRRPRGNLQALLTSAIIVLAAASPFFFIFTFEIPRALNNRREKVWKRVRLFSLLLRSPVAASLPSFPSSLSRFLVAVCFSLRSPRQFLRA